MGNPSFSLVRMVINLHIFLYIPECHLLPNISPLLYPSEENLECISSVNRPHVPASLAARYYHPANEVEQTLRTSAKAPKPVMANL